MEQIEKIAKMTTTIKLEAKRNAGWQSSDKMTWIPSVSETYDKLEPGFYEPVYIQNIGFVPKKLELGERDLFRLPDPNSQLVLEDIQNFWKKQEYFEKYKFPYKRGILMYGPPGCHAAGTKIIMYDGSTKNVEDVVLGDLLIGPDSKPRKVLDLVRGNEEMFLITPVKGKDFIVNRNHILSLQKSGVRNCNFPGILNVSVNDFLKMSKPAQEKFKLRKPKFGIDFNNANDLEIDPYFVGLWLGDGTSREVAITTADIEIKNYLYEYAKFLELDITEAAKPNDKASTFTFVGKSWHKNILRDKLISLNLRNNKHIPLQYITSSRENRLKLLAGIIDSDGYYFSNKKQGIRSKGYFEIVQKNNILSEQICYLASSLGLNYTIKKCVKSIKSINFSGEYNRINIFGPIEQIPVKLNRKKSLIGTPNKDHSLTGIKSIKSIGNGDFYGFTLSGDHLYLTNDFTIHHNCGKSCAIALLVQDVTQMGGIVLRFEDYNSWISVYKSIRQIQPDVPMIALLEDLDQIIDENSVSTILNLLDGLEQSLNKIVFLATTNNPQRIADNIKNRPSRFDRRVKIDLPNENIRQAYLEHLFSTGGSKIPSSDWITKTKGFSLAHLKELFISVICLGNDFNTVVDELKKMKEIITAED